MIIWSCFSYWKFGIPSGHHTRGSTQRGMAVPDWADLPPPSSAPLTVLVLCGAYGAILSGEKFDRRHKGSVDHQLSSRTLHRESLPTASAGPSVALRRPPPMPWPTSSTSSALAMEPSVDPTCDTAMPRDGGRNLRRALRAPLPTTRAASPPRRLHSSDRRFGRWCYRSEERRGEIKLGETNQTRRQRCAEHRRLTCGATCSAAPPLRILFARPTRLVRFNVLRWRNP